MTRSAIFLATAAAALLAIQSVSAQVPPAARPIGEADLAAAKAAVGDLAGRLKETLAAAIKEHGPVGAVTSCQTIAPPTERGVGADHQLTIKRTALKVRNPANVPDAFETRVLQQFQAQAKAGADPATLAAAEVVETAGGRQLRFMKAIPMADQPCATCHGNDLKPDVAARIRELYPQDQATGFVAGELRGAFSVTKKVD
jgi:hypothetical protein